MLYTTDQMSGGVMFFFLMDALNRSKQLTWLQKVIFQIGYIFNFLFIKEPYIYITQNIKPLNIYAFGRHIQGIHFILAFPENQTHDLGIVNTMFELHFSTLIRNVSYCIMHQISILQ